MDSKRKLVFVANYGDSNVTVYNTRNNTLIATIPTNFPIGIALDPVTGKVFAANYFAQTISVIDEKSLSVVATIADTDHSPYKMAVDDAHGTSMRSTWREHPPE